MKKNRVLIISAFLSLIMAVALFLVSKDKSVYALEVRDKIEYFNQISDVHFYISNNHFDDHFSKLKRASYFDVTKDIPHDAEINIYLINLEKQFISSKDYDRINSLLEQDVKILVYFIGGRDFSFLEGYQSLSLDKNGKPTYINKDAYIHRIDNLKEQVKVSNVCYDGTDKITLFSDYTYLQLLVYEKIEADLKAHLGCQ
ncbi:MAG TPA: hypothetical protein VJY66_02420 [Acholeplasma sp.]|nr:hypothetical protein [Acholeplasma sp.]